MRVFRMRGYMKSPILHNSNQRYLSISFNFRKNPGLTYPKICRMPQPNQPTTLFGLCTMFSNILFDFLRFGSQSYSIRMRANACLVNSYICIILFVFVVIRSPINISTVHRNSQTQCDKFNLRGISMKIWNLYGKCVLITQFIWRSKYSCF